MASVIIFLSYKYLYQILNMMLRRIKRRSVVNFKWRHYVLNNVSLAFDVIQCKSRFAGKTKREMVGNLHVVKEEAEWERNREENVHYSLSRTVNNKIRLQPGNCAYVWDGSGGGCLDGISWLQQHPSELSQRYLHQLETLSWPLAEWFLNPVHCTSPLHKHKIHNYTPSQQHSSYHTQYLTSQVITLPHLSV